MSSGYSKAMPWTINPMKQNYPIQKASYIFAKKVMMNPMLRAKVKNKVREKKQAIKTVRPR